VVAVNFMRILIVTTERESLNAFLDLSRFEPRWASGFEDGLSSAREVKPDFILIDADLPNNAGSDLLRKLRLFSRVPILLLSGVDDINQRLLGLKSGADDYLSKSCDPRELLARIEVIQRRCAITLNKPVELKYRGLKINIQNRSVMVDDKPISLSSMEFEALKLFAEQAGNVLSRDSLMRQLYGSQSSELSRSIDVLLSRLRQKLNDNLKNPRFFRTVRNEGYVFVAEASDESH
jgi:DNA-binding response OmpR family regulator